MTVKHKDGIKRVRSTLRATATLVTLYTVSAYVQVHGGEVSHWEGIDIFKEKGCAQCHSVFGRNGKDGPDLGKEKFYGTHLELAARMWNHFPKMYEKMQKTDVEFQAISAPRDMADLYAYLYEATHLPDEAA